MQGCLKGSLPVGGGSRIAEIKNGCIAYDRLSNSWGFTGKAVLAGSFNANIGATVTNGQLDAFSAGLGGLGKIPMPYGAYLNGGAVDVTGLRSSPAFRGTVAGGWPIMPITTNIVDIKINGSIGYNSGSRTMSITGYGELIAGGQRLADGNAALTVGLGTNWIPSSMQFNTNIVTLGGLVTGGMVATVDGSGFFASGTMTVGIPKGSQIGKDLDRAIEGMLFCNWKTGWINVNWCPYISGLSAGGTGAISNKGVGAKATLGWIHLSIWWRNQFNWNLGINSSTDITSVLRQQRSVKKHSDSSLTPEVFAEEKPRSWTIPAGVNLAALELRGSTTGDLKVFDPTGRMVIDTASKTAVEGVGFGRNPDGQGVASFGLFPPAIKAGVWKIYTSGEDPFTSIITKLAQEPESSKISNVIPVGKGIKPTVRQLIAGSSRIRVSWSTPTGATTSIRVTDGGTVTNSLATGLNGKGSRVFTVPVNWAGKMKIMAVTEHEGVPLETATFPTSFVVVRPKLKPVSTVKITRGSKGKITITWKRVSGASSYDVNVVTPSSKKGALIIAHGTKLTLTPRTTGKISVTVRGVSSIGISGSWSKPVKLKPISEKKRKSRR